jgi:AraC family transcriptional regulator
MNRFDGQSSALVAEALLDAVPPTAGGRFAADSSFPVVRAIASRLDSSRLRPRRSQSSEPVAPNNLSVAAHLIEAAHMVREGDPDAVRAHITRALVLLRGKLFFDPPRPHTSSKLQAHAARGGLPAWQTRKVLAHIEANLSRRIAIRELAGLVGLSPSHFCRVFKCTSGLAPREYVLRRRIEAAQQLMLTTSEPLSAIAVSCGMCDQSHLTRSFHRIVGETPHGWRRARRGAPI